jgi:hypothetical protein
VRGCLRGVNGRSEYENRGWDMHLKEFGWEFRWVG